MGGSRPAAGPERTPPVRRAMVLLLSLLPAALSVAAPLLEASDPPRSRAFLVDAHPPDQCPDVHHAHYLCLQVQQLVAWPAAGPDPLPPVLSDGRQVGLPARGLAAADQHLAVAARAPPLV